MEKSGDIRSILKKWHKANQKKKKLDGKIEEYKQQITAIMNNQRTNKLERGEYTVSREHATRTYISKESIPQGLWNEYSSRTSFYKFRLIKRG